MNYSKMQEETKVSKTFHKEGEERETLTTLHDYCCKYSAPAYSLLHSWHWAMMSTATVCQQAHVHIPGYSASAAHFHSYA